MQEEGRHCQQVAARRPLGAVTAAALLLLSSGAAWSRDWHFFRAGFERLIALHCAARWVVHPERAAPCVAEQRAAMEAWTGAMSSADTAPADRYFLAACRTRWSAAPHTNWVRAVACAREAQADFRAGRPPR